MIAFEVLVNGRRVCIASIANGLLRVGVEYFTLGAEEDRLWMHIGGAASPYEPRKWTVPCITLGDEVTVRIIDADGPDPDPICDPPPDRQPSVGS